jgi:hypothetical protein
MAALSEWLQIMLAEIARKRDDLERARNEERAREVEAVPPEQPDNLASRLPRAS